MEVDDAESYGWWPSRCPLRLWDVFVGTTGVLNGGTVDGVLPDRDPSHGFAADYEFHPVLLVTRTDDELRDHIRRFAHEFSGGWRWSALHEKQSRMRG